MNVQEGLKNLGNEPLDKDEELLNKEKELIYFLARASSIELVGMNKPELARWKTRQSLCKSN